MKMVVGQTQKGKGRIDSTLGEPLKKRGNKPGVESYIGSILYTFHSVDIALKTLQKKLQKRIILKSSIVMNDFK